MTLESFISGLVNLNGFVFLSLFVVTHVVGIFAQSALNLGSSIVYLSPMLAIILFLLDRNNHRLSPHRRGIVLPIRNFLQNIFNETITGLGCDNQSGRNR